MTEFQRGKRGALMDECYQQVRYRQGQERMRCDCHPLCAKCGHHPHMSAHLPAFGKDMDALPWGHEYVPTGKTPTYRRRLPMSSDDMRARAEERLEYEIADCEGALGADAAASAYPRASFEKDLAMWRLLLVLLQPEDEPAKPEDVSMADDCLGMIYEVLEKHIEMDGCPPMFYPEAIHNCIAMPKRAIMRATGAEEKVVGTATEDELVKLILTRYEKAEKLVAPLSKEEAQDAYRVFDAHALTEAIESVLRGRKAKWLEGEG